MMRAAIARAKDWAVKRWISFVLVRCGTLRRGYTGTIAERNRLQAELTKSEDTLQKLAEMYGELSKKHEIQHGVVNRFCRYLDACLDDPESCQIVIKSKPSAVAFKTKLRNLMAVAEGAKLVDDPYFDHPLQNSPSGMEH